MRPIDSTVTLWTASRVLRSVFVYQMVCNMCWWSSRPSLCTLRSSLRIELAPSSWSRNNKPREIRTRLWCWENGSDGYTDLVMSKMFVGDHKRKDNKNSNCVLVVEPIGKIVIAGASSKEPEKGYTSWHSKYIHGQVELMFFVFNNKNCKSTVLA